MKPTSMSRDDAIRLVQRVMDGDYETESESAALLDALEHGLVCPHITDLIFWPPGRKELTATEVVDRALAYEPFAL